MELYQLIATINNTAESFTLAYLPENFEGVKISQSFSFVNPIGYTPKFSVDTMRIIENDKITIDDVFDTYGLQSDVAIEIKKLNATGTGYTTLSSFAIDFESYEKFDVYSEFALKSISAIDDYNKIKNTEITENLNTLLTIPPNFYFQNYVSLKKDDIITTNTYKKIFRFSENNESKFFNEDSVLHKNITVYGQEISKADVYNFAETVTNYKIYISYKIDMYFALGSSGIITLNLLTNTANIFTFYAHYFDGAGSHGITYKSNPIEINYHSFNKDDSLYVRAEATTGTDFTMGGSLSFDLRIETEKKIIEENKNILAINSETIFNNLFANNINLFSNELKNINVVTTENLTSDLSTITFKPKDFINDFCLISGAMINFKNNGKVEVLKMQDYFSNLLQNTNAVEIKNIKDISIKYNTKLNFASVSSGEELKEYYILSYLIKWNKILTFYQDRNASENLGLTLSKFRTDFLGILDYLYQKSIQKDVSGKDLFFVDKNMIARTSPTANVYDYFTPRDILENWRTFLSFCFQNYGKTTLTISANGGTDDNLQIDGVNQMDDFVLAETPRLLPIEYNFTCLIDEIDFSEKILKINDNGTDVYLFVINAETTDTLSEQKIQALKIQF